MDHLTTSRSIAGFRRIDVLIKMLVHEQNIEKVNSYKTIDIYKQHLRYWNNFEERNPPRSSFDDFKAAFGRSYSAESPLVLPTIILGRNNQLLNGSHRLASALNKGWPIKFKHGDFNDGQDMVT